MATNTVALFRKQTHLITVKESLDILRAVSGVVPIFGPQLSALVDVVHNIVGIMQVCNHISINIPFAITVKA